MNIEKSIEILKEFRNYNKFYKEENRDLTITITLEAKESIDKAIERLLTAYEKEVDKHFVPIERYNQLEKEIEELKDESKEYQIGFAQGCYEKDLDWKDKIKAKIEEIEEILNGQLIEKLRVYFEAQKEVLQGLLEKE